MPEDTATNGYAKTVGKSRGLFVLAGAPMREDEMSCDTHLLGALRRIAIESIPNPLGAGCRHWLLKCAEATEAKIMNASSGDSSFSSSFMPHQ